MPPQPKVKPRRQPARATANEPAEDIPQETLPRDGDAIDVEMADAGASGSEQQPSVPTASGTTPELALKPTSQYPSTAAQPNRRPVQRLASLNPRAPGASGSRPAGLKFQPKSFIRRSKEEREAQEKAEEQRKQARIAAEGASRSSAQRGGQNGRGGARGGGMNRLNQNRYSGGQASGALGGSTIGGDSTKKRPGFGGLFGGGFSGGRSSSVKRETDRDGNVFMGGRSKIKKEVTRQGYASDDDFDDAEGPRVNIEHINLISDEDSQEEQPEKPTQHQHKRPGRDANVHVSGLKPVRIDRHEHVERSVGVNTEASSTTMADVRRKAKERALAEGGLFLSDDDAEAGKSSKSKGKGKAKDVEFVKDERKWQGVYPEDEDIYNIPKIKEEPQDDTEPMVIDDTLPTETPTTTTVEAPSQTTPPKASRKVEQPPSRRKVRVRRTSRGKTPKPVLQTAEDRQEWERYQEDLYILSEELGTLSTTKAPAITVDSTNAGEDGGKADAEARPEAKKDRKQGLVYLFQLPPIIPSLITPAEKEEAEAAAAKKPSPPPEKPEKPEKKALSSSVGPPSNPFSAAHKTEPLIKPDPDSKFSLTSAAPNKISLGKAGKLTVLGSGNVKATWGGVGMEVGRGGDGGILQEVIFWQEGKKRAEAMGQVAGGFVGVPQWGGMVG